MLGIDFVKNRVDVFLAHTFRFVVGPVGLAALDAELYDASIESERDQIGHLTCSILFCDMLNTVWSRCESKAWDSLCSNRK
jgi:hypothetical protein